MAEVVNLRLARKAKARAEKDRIAEANRLAHGRPKSESGRHEKLRALDEKRLDGHRLTSRDP